MGAKSTYLRSPERSKSLTEKETTFSSNNETISSVPEMVHSVDGQGDMEFSILEDLLIDILSYMSAKDLIKNCRLVCREWKNIIDGHSVWKIKCEREKKCIPVITFDKLPVHYYEKIYMHNPYGRNLIENACGEDRLEKWTMTRNGGDGFAVENPPKGSDPVPGEVGSTSCFATAFLPCVKHQIIDLISVGIDEAVLQLKTTKIQIGEWYSARFDCASEYRLNVTLLDGNYNEMDQLLTLDDHLTDNFEFYYREDQWVGKEWHKVTHTFENVGSARYIFFQHFGKDCQYWAGNYGSKMTGAFVKVLV